MFKKILIIIFILISIVVIAEAIARLAIASLLKDKIDPQKIRTEFEEIYIPPFARKEENEFRIFVYGGSSVQGIPHPDFGFVKQLEYQLHHVYEGKNIKVFNLGWAGFNSTRIRYMFNRTVNEEPDLVIVYTGENEFIYPQLDFYNLVRTVTAAKKRSGLARLTLSLSGSNSNNKSQIQSSNSKIQTFTNSNLYKSAKMQIFKNNLQAIVDKSVSRNIPVVFGIPASNLSDWPPVKKENTVLEVSENYKSVIYSTNEMISSENYQEAISQLNETFGDQEEDATVNYLKGVVYLKTENDAESFFIRAKDNDPVPWRTLSEHAVFVESLKNKKKVWVLNFPDIFSKQSKNIVGLDYVFDNTHPNKDGSFVISTKILELISKDVIKSDKINDPYSKKELFEQMGINAQDDFEAYLKTAHFALKAPFFNTKIASYYLDLAEDIEKNNWETIATRVSIANMEGDTDKAKVLLEKAEKLKGSKINSDESNHIPYLFEILSK